MARARSQIFSSDGQRVREQFNALQSLRGLAALVVVIRHVLSFYPLTGHTSTVVVFFLLNSPAAVTVFFVLSGFVLSHSLEGQKLAWPMLRTFWVRRVFRIMPALILVTGISLLYTRLPIAAWPLRGTAPEADGLLPYQMPMSIVQAIKCFLGLASTLVPQNWTVTVELLVAIVFPFLCVAARRGTLIFSVLAVASILMSVFAPDGGKGLPFLYLPAFVAGIVTYRVWRNTHFTLTGWGVALSFVLLSLPTTLLTEPEHLAMEFNAPKIVLPEIVFAAFLILGLARPNAVTRALSARPWVILGDVSFGIYLIHFLVIALMARLLAPLLGTMARPEQMLLMLLAVVPVTTAASIAIYHWVEWPLNILGRRLTR